ncbi:MAG: FHA domain-containing protein, partial [Anaerolineae bacterium]|nr:FHA domain-containing protein [Anaerolineae bacterium]
DEEAFDPQDADRTFIEEDVLPEFDPDRTFIREEIPVPAKAKLIAVRGEFLLAQPEFELPTGPTTIGRNSSKGTANDIALSDRETSRSHAKITYRSGSYYIQDLNSSTGTKLNGEKLPALEEVLLTHDVELAIGPNVTFKFDYDAAAAPDKTIFEVGSSLSAATTGSTDDRTLFEITEEERA